MYYTYTTTVRYDIYLVKRQRAIFSAVYSQTKLFRQIHNLVRTGCCAAISTGCMGVVTP